MREIIFKAKRTDNGEWVEGYPFPSIVGKELNRMTVFEPFPGGTVVNTYEVEPETICQYTGLTDKNGVRIWEGDILEYDEERWVVSYIEEDAMFFIYMDGLFEHFGNVTSSFCEVTGNIHDNTSTDM